MVTHLDDILLRKREKKVPGTTWRRDSLAYYPLGRGSPDANHDDELIQLHPLLEEYFLAHQAWPESPILSPGNR